MSLLGGMSECRLVELLQAKKVRGILDERSALNFAENEGLAKGIAKGKMERDSELVEKWKNKGLTESQIKDLLS